MLQLTNDPPDGTVRELQVAARELAAGIGRDPSIERKLVVRVLAIAASRAKLASAQAASAGGR